MKRPEWVMRMAHWCDVCKKRTDGTGVISGGVYYGRCCGIVQHRIWKKEMAMRAIKVQPFFGAVNNRGGIDESLAL